MTEAVDASLRCFGSAGNCTEPPAYVWTGPHGGKCLLCGGHCAEWRAEVRGGPLEPVAIGKTADPLDLIEQHDAAREASGEGRMVPQAWIDQERRNR